MSWSSGTNTIKEGDESKSLTLQMLELKKQGGGTEYFVRKNDVKLGTKSVTQNGTYTAAADGKYGFSQFSVNVRGGSGSADSHGRPTGGDIKPGGAGSAVVGTDPETGNDVAVGVDENGNLVQTPVPSGIEIVTPPTKTSYSAGDTMIYDGLVVKMVNRDGTTFKDATHPNGHLSLSELFFPVETAPAAERGGESRAGAYYISSGGKEGVCTQPDGTGGDLVVPEGVRYCGFKQAGSNSFWVYAIGLSPFYMDTYTQNTGELESHIEASAMVVDGSTYYIAGGSWYNPPATPIIDYTLLSPTEQRTMQEIAYEIMYGGQGGTAEIPVQWINTYTGEQCEDSFVISVSPGDSTTTSSSGTEGSGGGGTF